MEATNDALDQIVDDLHRLFPDLEVIGIGVTGRILRLARFLEARREEVLTPFGLSIADFDVLATMRRRAGTDAINIKVLQQSMMLSSGGTTKRLDRLEKAGLIERHPDPNDRRGVLVGLTAHGLDVIDRALVAITTNENGLVGSAIGQERLRKQVIDGLRRFLVAQEEIGPDVRQP